MIFSYPIARDERRHGPSGYTNYARYLPWLRDEFCFRCVYCLNRENWTQVVGAFEIDHIVPQSNDKTQITSYENLAYCCHRCNKVKSDRRIDNPMSLLVYGNIQVLESGKIEEEGLSIEVKRVVRKLDLNSDEMVNWRLLWFQVASRREGDSDVDRRVLGFPEYLPNLRKLKPPANGRPDGIKESWFARVERGELPDEY